ncbi:MAG TPA: glycosyltransferase family 4 protein, partial [Sphingobacteriaceae bacterium]
DVLVFQSPKNYLHDQYEILTEEQRQLPKIYLEHDPPQGVPTDTKHPVDDPNVLLVHVTHFNCLMWDNNRTPTKVIDHGVIVPEGIGYSGEIPRGIVVINNLEQRGRRLGVDVFHEIRKYVPIDLIGMGTEGIGLGEVLHPNLPAFISRYRFFLNPIRYTSLGLSVIEAMMLGIPVVGLATTEMVTVINNGVSGILHTDVRYLIDKMQQLLEDKELARQLGENGRKVVNERFNIGRFTADWEDTFHQVIRRSRESALTA